MNVGMVDGNDEGWTFETLKSYIDERLRSIELALGRTEAETDKRFEGVNEFRALVNDILSNMLPRAEYSVQHTALIDRIDANSRRIDALVLTVTEQGARDTGKRQGLGLLGSIVIGTIAALSSLALIVSTVVHFFGK